MMKTGLIVLLLFSASLFAEPIKDTMKPDVSDDDFFKAHDELMKSFFDSDMQSHFEKMEQEMDEMFQDFHQRRSFARKQNNLIELSEKVTDEYHLFEVTSSEGDLNAIKVSVRSGTLVLSGEIKIVKVEDEIRSESVRQYYQMFSLPDGVDEKNPIIDRKKDKIIIKFKRTTNLKGNKKLPIKGISI